MVGDQITGLVFRWQCLGEGSNRWPTVLLPFVLDKRMPDLNWKNPAVQQAMRDVAEFWVEKGIDGLRLDAFIHLAKADFRQTYPNPTAIRHLSLVTCFMPTYRKCISTYTILSPQSKPSTPDTYVVGEASSADPHLMVDYTTPGTDECDRGDYVQNFCGRQYSG